MAKDDTYIPALRFDWLTPLYDPILRLVMREEKFKKELVRQAQLQAGQKVLDLGCGTATLTILVKLAHPSAEVVGLDGDSRVLAVGRAKAARAGAALILDQGLSFQLPYPDQSFDRVLSSLLFHHLTMENKRRTLGEAYRVLRQGGELHLADFGRPRTTWARWVSPLMARLEEVSDNHKGLLPSMMQQAGFKLVDEGHHFSTLFGTLTLYRGQKPGIKVARQ
jgi:ubiquinone/menaquinone biosynthesis C-methylase UbiE